MAELYAICFDGMAEHNLRTPAIPLHDALDWVATVNTNEIESVRNHPVEVLVRYPLGPYWIEIANDTNSLRSDV